MGDTGKGAWRQRELYQARFARSARRHEQHVARTGDTPRVKAEATPLRRKPVPNSPHPAVPGVATQDDEFQHLLSKLTKAGPAEGCEALTQNSGPHARSRPSQPPELLPYDVSAKELVAMLPYDVLLARHNMGAYNEDAPSTLVELEGKLERAEAEFPNFQRMQEGRIKQLRRFAVRCWAGCFNKWNRDAVRRTWTNLRIGAKDYYFTQQLACQVERFPHLSSDDKVYYYSGLAKMYTKKQVQEALVTLSLYLTRWHEKQQRAIQTMLHVWFRKFAAKHTKTVRRNRILLFRRIGGLWREREMQERFTAWFNWKELYLKDKRHQLPIAMLARSAGRIRHQEVTTLFSRTFKKWEHNYRGDKLTLWINRSSRLSTEQKCLKLRTRSIAAQLLCKIECGMRCNERLQIWTSSLMTEATAREKEATAREKEATAREKEATAREKEATAREHGERMLQRVGIRWLHEATGRALCVWNAQCEEERNRTHGIIVLNRVVVRVRKQKVAMKYTIWQQNYRRSKSTMWQNRSHRFKGELETVKCEFALVTRTAAQNLFCNLSRRMQGAELMDRLFIWRAGLQNEEARERAERILTRVGVRFMNSESADAVQVWHKQFQEWNTLSRRNEVVTLRAKKHAWLFIAKAFHAMREEYGKYQLSLLLAAQAEQHMDYSKQMTLRFIKLNEKSSAKYQTLCVQWIVHGVGKVYDSPARRVILRWRGSSKPLFNPKLSFSSPFASAPEKPPADSPSATADSPSATGKEEEGAFDGLPSMPELPKLPTFGW